VRFQPVERFADHAIGIAHLLVQKFQLLACPWFRLRQDHAEVVRADLNHTERLADIVQNPAQDDPHLLLLKRAVRLAIGRGTPGNSRRCDFRFYGDCRHSNFETRGRWMNYNPVVAECKNYLRTILRELF
jgi:hypothetical protein